MSKPNQGHHHFEEAILVLKKVFGYVEFRPGQASILEGILSRQDTLGVMPTGQGKSLCYQVPALMVKGLALVITPLIALMKDQEDQLQKLSYPARSITSFTTPKELEQIFLEIEQERLKLLYISPERLESERFLYRIRYASLSFVAIDEAHCISEWGYDFRSSYQRIVPNLKKIKQELPPILALTATATPEVLEDIRSFLLMRSPHVYIGGFARSNLSLSMFELSDKFSKLQKVLEGVSGPSIVYVNTRKETVQVKAHLSALGIRSGLYHGGMEEEERKISQDNFFKNNHRVIIATSAFGMGINKKDIRSVIHFSPPFSPEQYYQEVGRAGRDGKKSYGVMLYNERDIMALENRIESQFPAEKDVLLLMKTIEKKIDLGSSLSLSKEEVYDMFKKKFSGKNILTLLRAADRYKFITFNEKEGDADSLFFSSSESQIESWLSSPSEKKLWEALLRSVGKQPFKRKVYLNFENFCKKYFLPKKPVIQILLRMSNDKMIEFSLTDQLEISYNYRPSKKDFLMMKKRRKSASKKLEAMRHILKSRNCRMSEVLKYFSDPDYEKQCQICDNCLYRKSVG